MKMNPCPSPSLLSRSGVARMSSSVGRRKSLSSPPRCSSPNLARSVTILRRADMTRPFVLRRVVHIGWRSRSRLTGRALAQIGATIATRARLQVFTSLIDDTPLCSGGLSAIIPQASHTYNVRSTKYPEPAARRNRQRGRGSLARSA